jgi:hypothetical protein
MALTIDTITTARLDPYRNPELAKTEAFQFAPNLTVVKGTIVGFITATKFAKPYSNANSDGTETASVIAQYSFTTDGSGKVTFSGERFKRDTAPCYTSGDFLVSDLTGLDAAAIAELGRVENGVLRM